MKMEFSKIILKIIVEYIKVSSKYSKVLISFFLIFHLKTLKQSKKKTEAQNFCYQYFSATKIEKKAKTAKRSRNRRYYHISKM